MNSARRQATRERLVQAAADLFHLQGIHATGIEAVIEAAGISRPALYQHFRSKEALVRAALELRDINRRQRIEQEARRGAGDAANQLRAVFDGLAEWAGEPGFRGCALMNAAAETPAGDAARLDVVRAHKRWVRAFLAGLALRAGCRQPERLAGQLLVLMEGAVAMALVEGSADPARDARTAAHALIAGALEPPVGPRRADPPRGTRTDPTPERQP
jgi:AcrR family transcriptional regulator